MVGGLSTRRGWKEKPKTQTNQPPTMKKNRAEFRCSKIVNATEANKENLSLWQGLVCKSVTQI